MLNKVVVAFLFMDEIIAWCDLHLGVNIQMRAYSIFKWFCLSFGILQDEISATLRVNGSH